MVNKRTQEIKKKGFNISMEDERYEDISMRDTNLVDFAKIQVGAKYLDDAILEISNYKKLDARLGDKENVLEAIHRGDIEQMCEISNFFYKTSGIYARLCRYLAYLYRYDWFLVPYLPKKVKKSDELVTKFNEVLTYLENFEAKKVFGEIALKVIRNGCYYGYKVETKDRTVLQELPIHYCRSRFSVNNHPAVEFNMKFFEDKFRDETQRKQVLGLFPKEFQKGYNLYKAGKLPPAFTGDQAGWYLLEPKNAVKFNINGEDYPMLISVIPALIDLDTAQELDRKKMQQKLLKVIIQKMPLDKNGDLIFDVDEAQQLHNNAVKMLSKAIGIDVLTTFADVEVADMADRNTTTTTDELEKVERTVFNEAGISQMQFNTDGNIALEKSILNDEAALYNLITQFEAFLNTLIEKFNKPKKISFKAQILTTTIYNYKEVSKLYKEQTQLGYSKMLPQIALGNTQGAILATAFFENDILDLVNVFVPPLSSNVMNADVLNKTKTGAGAGGSDGEKQAGRPEKENDQKSEKTIKNRESMN